MDYLRQSKWRTGLGNKMEMALKWLGRIKLGYENVRITIAGPA